MKSKIYKRSVALLGLMFLVVQATACSSVTMREKGTTKLERQPSWESTKPYFLWGLVGEHHVSLAQACGGKRPVQWQAQDTFVDGLLATLTLGIYYPRTAKVWCE